MAKKAIVCKNGPSAVGPYSHACEVNGLVFLSGMLGLDPKTGDLAPTVEAQAELALSNIQAVLAELALAMKDVVKTTVFLADMGDFAAVNAVYARFFPSDYPARSCVAVKALPRGALVEIESIASR